MFWANQPQVAVKQDTTLHCFNFEYDSTLLTSSVPDKQDLRTHNFKSNLKRHINHKCFQLSEIWQLVTSTSKLGHDTLNTNSSSFSDTSFTAATLFQSIDVYTIVQLLFRFNIAATDMCIYMFATTLIYVRDFIQQMLASQH